MSSQSSQCLVLPWVESMESLEMTYPLYVVGILQVVSLPVIVSMVGGKDITYRARDDPCGHYGWEAGQPKLYCRFLWVVLHFAFEVECNLIVRCPPAGLLKSGSLVG